MSSESRAAVLNSIRFEKSENGAFAYVFGSLMAYALFTRSLADLEENALPFFLILVAGYQIVGSLVLLFSRQMPDLWDLVHFTFGTTIFAAGWVLYMYGGIAIAFDVWLWLKAFWANLDPLANRTQFMVVTGLLTLTAGGLFFGFRLKQRFLYGFTEACVGVVVGMHRVTLEEWPGVPRSTSFYLALLTAGIYLVVRGLDNMHQATRDGDPTLQRFIRFVLRKSLSSKVTRRHLSRVRPSRVRKVKTVKR